MANKSSKSRYKYIAQLVTEHRAPCAFCQREVDDEITYGKLYAIGDIQCHYFCVLLSCCLVQKGKDDHGLFGFMYPDILTELERSKKHRCSYCGKGGATLGCSITQCRKQFHLPCGREKNAVSLFFGNYKSFCQNHAPKQNIADVVMTKAKVRMQEKRKALRALKEHGVQVVEEKPSDETFKIESVCVICYEEVDCFPTVQTFWPPCCARDAWFHRSCLQRMALSAGMHYLKCPLCNDKETFYQAVIAQGYYVPDRDAAWELEQNAFAEIYMRPLSCSMEECLCPLGREHDAETGLWDIKLCILCGSEGGHAGCLPSPEAREAGKGVGEGELEAGKEVGEGLASPLVCRACRPAAPEDLERLMAQLHAVMLTEQASRSNNPRRGPLMPSRMSLRRTKQRIACNQPSSSQNNAPSLEAIAEAPSNTISSREELNLKTPKLLQNQEYTVLKQIDNKITTPVKLLQEGLKEKARNMGASETENIVFDERIVEKLRLKFKKPKPLSEKRKIVNDILDDLFNNISKDKLKVKEPIIEWNSPKKDTRHCEEVKIETSDIPTDTEDHQNTVTIDENADKEIKETSNPIEDIEDSSNSTFQLPSEFIAEHNSDDSLPIFDTPKKLKTVEIQKDSSMEISENNDIINIDLVKIDTEDVEDKSTDQTEKCAFKFSPKDKDVLEAKNMDIDVECFKNHYLNEVDREFCCKFSHKHDEKVNKSPKLRTAIDFAVEASKVEKKKHKNKKNKSNASEVVLRYKSKRKKDRKLKTKLSIRNDNMRVKISLKKEKFRLRIMQERHKMPKPMKQYVLKYSPGSSQEIEKPENDVTPIKRKYIKQEKTPDNLIQTSIQSFFKTQPNKK